MKCIIRRALVGLAYLGDTNNEHLVKFQQTIEGSNSDDRQPLVKTMLVFMVRGLFSSLQYPYVQFACRSRMGMRVLAANLDSNSHSPTQALQVDSNPD